MVFDFGSLRVFVKGFRKKVLGLGGLGGRWSVDRERVPVVMNRRHVSAKDIA
jgi:hypothetical protein